MNNFELNKSLEEKLTILLYHGVTKEKREGIINYQGKHISDLEFYEQMKFVKEFCTPLDIDEWIEIKEDKKNIPPYPTLITFDDGFKNNLEVASPILEDFSVPTTFYLSSGMINSDLMFWVDIVEQCLNLSDRRAIKLKLEEEVEFNIGSLEGKLKALLDIKKWCKSQKDLEKERVIKDLIQQTEVEPDKDKHPNYQTLNWDEVKQLNSKELFTIGGHTHTHTILSSLTDNQLDFQISKCINEISKNLNMNLRHFSYPEGQSNHFNERVIEILKEKNIICCPTAMYGFNDFDEDLFHLKRVMVGFEGAPFPHIKKNN